MPLKRIAASFLIVFLASSSLQVTSGKKYERSYPSNECSPQQYLCRNGDCIEKHSFCDGSRYGCGDNSDEEYCRMGRQTYGNMDLSPCPTHYPFFRCTDGKCIPELWVCDESNDCSHGDDELNCGIYWSERVLEKAQNWIWRQTREESPVNRWGADVHRLATALYFTTAIESLPERNAKLQTAYEVDMRLLEIILMEKIHDKRYLSSNELALYLNALLVSCIDPRNFHGMDLVARLRQEVDQRSGYVSPFVLLALCNSGDDMTQEDVQKLFRALGSRKRTTWTDVQSFAIMALSCIKKGRNGEYVSKSTLNDFVFHLMGKALGNGSFGILPTTALVAQALFASGRHEAWNSEKTIEFLIENQLADGSFGTLLNTYYVIPVLNSKSLVDINATHCDAPEPYTVGVWKSKLIDHIKVKYSVVYGDKFIIDRSTSFEVQVNSSVFDLMKKASVLNEKYRFEYTVENSKPYIYEINGVQDDEETGKYWFLCKVSTTKNVPVSIDSSPVDVIAKDEEEYAMWYRTAAWLQNSTSLTS